jgi:prevent-host-death family protein
MATVRGSKSMGAYAARTHFSELLERVEAGEEITITRHGSPVVRMVPVKRKTTPEQRRAAFDAMRRLAEGLSLRGLRIEDLVGRIGVERRFHHRLLDHDGVVLL